MTFCAQAAPLLGRKAEGRGSWVKVNGNSDTEELHAPSLLIGGSRSSCTFTKTAPSG